MNDDDNVRTSLKNQSIMGVMDDDKPQIRIQITQRFSTKSLFSDFKFEFRSRHPSKSFRESFFAAGSGFFHCGKENGTCTYIRDRGLYDSTSLSDEEKFVTHNIPQTGSATF